MQQRIGSWPAELPCQPQRFLDDTSIPDPVEATAFHGALPGSSLLERTASQYVPPTVELVADRTVVVATSLEVRMDTDRIVGSAKSMAGKVEKAAGDVFDDKQTQAEGAATEAEGTLQNTYGQVKDAARGAAQKASAMASDAYDEGADIVAERPGSALLVAGLIGFALGVVVARGSQPPRPRWQRVYYG
jgi:uncharacterized protein YjbJ (UPF0337 family)